MIYPLVGIVIGAVLGAIMAKRRGGTRADMAQWGAALAMIGGVIGLFVLVFIERSYL